MADWMLGGARRPGTPSGLVPPETFAADGGDDPEPSGA